MNPSRDRRRASLSGLLAAAVAAAGVACEAPRPDPEPAPSREAAVAPDAPADPRARLTGTWRLARVERHDQFGAPLPEFVHPGIGQDAAVGYLMYDGERVGMVVQREGADPTPDAEAPAGPDAAAAVARYSAYFGRYAFGGQEGYLTHRISGSLDPGLTGTELLLRYELADDRLILLPPLQCPDSFVTDRGCGYGTVGVQLRNVWERVEPAPAAAAEARDLLGFWEIERIERRTADGDDVPTEQYAAGNLIYMPSGHMAVHLMRAGRRPYAAPPPTPSEAVAALQGYVSYFGPFQVLPDEGVVVHHRTGHLDPRAVGSAARRGFTLREGRLLLEPPAATVDGQTIRTTVVWNRLGSP
ncbi:MAG: lipocalin-like domain-containing protein [Acidobacteria bacterium]|nr:lipocalin-like domain-containing protein [Acidobacteriota bacterium]